MAKVRFGGGVSEMRGSIAGNVFSRNRSGAIVRNRAVPVNQPTPIQTAYRAAFNTVVQSYRNLTEAQIDLWTSWSSGLSALNSLGESYTPSPEQAFMTQNMNLIAAGQSLITTPPVGTPELPTLDDFKIDAGTVAAGVIASLDITATSSTGAFCVVEATMPHQPSIRNVSRLLRNFFVGGDALATQDVLPEYKLRFAGGANIPATVGQIVSMRARAVSPTSGLSSPWQYDRLILTV